MAERGPYAKSATTREQVLDAVLGVVASAGYSGATLQHVADAVGMSKAGILHHFDSRDALLVAVLARRDEVTSLRVQDGSIPLASEHPAILDELIGIMRHNATVPGLVALYTALAGAAAAEAGDTDSHRYFADRFARLRADFTEAVRHEQQDGAIRGDIPAESAAALLIAAADGLQTQWLLDGAVDMGAHLEVLATVLRPAGPAG